MTNKSFGRWAAFGCIKGPSRAGKSEIPGTIRAPDGGVIVDSVRVAETYKGRCFPNMTVEVVLVEPDDGAPRQWIINGEGVTSATGVWRLRVDRDLTIEAGQS